MITGMRMQLSISQAVITVLVALVGSPAAAQPPRSAAVPPEGAADRQAQLNRIHREQADDYRIYLTRDRQTLLELRTEPIYVWTNPTRNHVQEGAVFVWMHAGRPEAIGTIFSHPDDEQPGMRQVNHEFHSLSRSTLFPVHEAQVWRLRTGTKTRPLPDAPDVAETSARRLLQMRSLAREFSARSDGGEGPYELRMLPRPIFRYEPESGDVLDGAVFVYATNAGTDPEAVLLIEAVNEDGRLRWEYALCRFSD